jgi:hypothetical protein
LDLTYGAPAIVQAKYEWPAGTAATLRAMAILPGGRGTRGVGPGCKAGGLTTDSMRVPNTAGTRYTTNTDPNAATTQKLLHRSEVQCWKQPGRALYFIDVETGKLIKKIFDTSGTNDPSSGLVLPSPISGSPTAYQDGVSTVATEAFVIDADGVMWRIDMSAVDPRPTEPYAGWTMRPFHDLFWDMGPSAGETTYESPILSLDQERRLVVIAGTGDSDNFDKPTVRNRVVSMTEITTSTTPNGPSDYTGALNWQLGVDTDGNGFVPSELVTGTMALFEGQLYIGSFISVVNNSNACDAGKGRLWSVDFVRRDINDPNPVGTGGIATYGPVRLNVVDNSTGADAAASLFNVSVANAEPNLLIQGLGTTQRLSCQLDAASLSSYFSPALVNIKQSEPPSIWIVAQASSTDTKRNKAGSLLGSVELKVNRPLTFSRVISWAGSID